MLTEDYAYLSWCFRCRVAQKCEFFHAIYHVPEDQLGILELMIHNGADLDWEDEDGLTALEFVRRCSSMRPDRRRRTIKILEDAMQEERGPKLKRRRLSLLAQRDVSPLLVGVVSKGKGFLGKVVEPGKGV
jgi:hypothetical protein